MRFPYLQRQNIGSKLYLLMELQILEVLCEKRVLYILYIAVVVVLCFPSSLVSEVMGNYLCFIGNFNIFIESRLVPETSPTP